MSLEHRCWRSILDGDVSAVEWSLNGSDKNGFGALHIAVQEHKDIVGNLIALKADVNMRHRRSEEAPLHFAAWEGEKSTIMLLLNKKARINHQDKNGSTALHWAVRANRLDCVKLLIHMNANSALKDDNGKLPIHFLRYRRDKPTYLGFVKVHEEKMVRRREAVRQAIAAKKKKEAEKQKPNAEEEAARKKLQDDLHERAAQLKTSKRRVGELEGELEECCEERNALRQKIAHIEKRKPEHLYNLKVRDLSSEKLDTTLNQCKKKLGELKHDHRKLETTVDSIYLEKARRNKKECVVCRVLPPVMVFLPCGHIVTCEACSDHVTNDTGKCIICRRDVSSSVKTFTV